MHPLLRCLCAGLAGALLPLAAHALPGDADPAFGNNGTTIVSFTPLLGAGHQHRNLKSTLDNQGRLWVFTDTLHTLTPPAYEGGVGITRLTRRGQLDTSFGNQGISYFPADHFNHLVGAQSVNGRTYMAFTTYGTDADPTVTWQVCRLDANGALDNSWFGSGCGSLTLTDHREENDLLVDPVSGNAWILGTGQDSNSNQFHAVLGVFDNTNHQAELKRFFLPGQDLRANQGVPDGNGGLYFSGSIYVSNFSDKLVMGHLAKQPGGGFDMNLGTPVVFNADSGPVLTFPVCIQRTAQGKLQLGLDIQVADAPWGTVQFLDNGSLDTSYGNSGVTQDVVADTSRNIGFGVDGCQRGSDGRLNMVGTYLFHGAVANTSESVPTLHRMQPGGYPDQAFGGDLTVPGTTFPMAYPGTAMNNFRVFTPPQPRHDAGNSIQVQPNGMLLLSGLSGSGDGDDTHTEVAVMRLQDEDAIFTDGME